MLPMEITVVGTGRAARPPERATLHLVAGFEGADKAAVLAQTTRLVQQLTDEIGRLRADSTHPTTWSAVLPIGTRSWRPWSNDGAVLPMRYGASAQIRIKFRDFRALSAFVDAWGGVEGVTVHGVQWALTEAVRIELERAVRTSAVADARERAQSFATAAGGGAVRCVQLADPGMLVEGRVEMAPAAMMARGAAAKDQSGGIELSPEDIEVEAVVHARFVAD